LRLKPIVYFSSVLLVLSCAALGQTPINSTASAPAPEPAIALPEAATAASPAVLPEAGVLQAIVLPEAPSHRFFDKTNLWLHLGAVAGETADLISTRRVLQLGGREADPLARPFVRAGAGGQIVGTYAIGEGAVLLASYLFHRTGHHRMERLVPISAFIIESLAAASNIRTEQRLHR
jgi:hypothetical protein